MDAVWLRSGCVGPIVTRRRTHLNALNGRRVRKLRRSMKQTLATRHIGKVARFTTNGVTKLQGPTTRALYPPSTLRKLRTRSQLDINPLLGAFPPSIAASEATLSRKQTTALAQLRSGQCHLLRDYQVLTGRGASAICPECLLRHMASHLFSCDATPTNLKVIDLWKNTVRSQSSVI